MNRYRAETAEQWWLRRLKAAYVEGRHTLAEYERTVELVLHSYDDPPLEEEDHLAAGIPRVA